MEQRRSWRVASVCKTEGPCDPRVFESLLLHQFSTGCKCYGSTSGSNPARVGSIPTRPAKFMFYVEDVAWEATFDARNMIFDGWLTERQRMGLLNPSQPKGCKCSIHLPSANFGMRGPMAVNCLENRPSSLSGGTEFDSLAFLHIRR